MADYTLVDVPSIFAPSIEEVIQHSAFTTLVLERNRMGLHAALAKMPALQGNGARAGAMGAVLINKTPFIEFLSPSEFSKRLDCGILGVVSPAADLHADRETDEVTVLSRPEIPFSQSIEDIARRLNLPSVRFLTADVGIGSRTLV
jgi:hypothetical protein